MKQSTVACVMEQTWGNITHYLNLRRHEAALPGCTPKWLPIVYQHGRVPWTVTGSLAARRALKPLLPEVDAIFVHGVTLAPLMADYLGSRPTILSADGTPASKHAMREAYGLREEPRWVKRAKRAMYSRVFSRARGFVAWSNWAKQSFVEDYGCREEDVIVIPPGIDSEYFITAEPSNELPCILFVGADFRRKGGELLVQVFRDRLRGKAELVLVTRAPVAEERGVRVFGKLEPNSPFLRELYRNADIFALPSRADCYSLVCLEALACGLPIVATRVGGIPDIVREGTTGHLLAVGDANGLGDTLEALISEPARRRAMGRQGRLDALTRFDSRDNTRRLLEFIRERC